MLNGADPAWALALQAATAGLRQSLWLYPLTNAAHLVGMALLFGAIVPLDLRLLGRATTLPLDIAVRWLRPVALAGAALAVPTGLLLWACRPLDYLASGWFMLKIGLLLLAAVNALAWRPPPDGRLRRRDAVAGLLSLGLWLAVIVAGRLIGYR